MSDNIVNAAYTSISQCRTAAAPSAFTPVANVTIDPVGYYDVEVVVGFGATAEATTADNFQLAIGSTPVTDKIYSPVGVNGWTSPTMKFKVSANGNTSLSINVGGTAGSAGAIYKAQLTATRIL